MEATAGPVYAEKEGVYANDEATGRDDDDGTAAGGFIKAESCTPRCEDIDVVSPLEAGAGIAG